MTDHASTIAAGARAAEAAAVLAGLSGLPRHDVAVVLGSGWVPAADLLGETTLDLANTDLPHFTPPAVAGHAGRVRSVEADGIRVLVFLGRTHLYEEHGVDAVTHAVRTASAAGCSTVVLTNGCGGLDPTWQPGTPVLIKDHINLTGASPLHGAHFVDLTDLYSARLRAMCQSVEPGLAEGVYAQFRGPMYETPAEIGMVRAMGGTLVGMSTALEAIVCRSLGMEVLGLSLVTNLAAGMSGAPLNHEEVLEAGTSAATRMGSLLAKVIRELR
ncbi:MAG: purine-nucleoside phosphorylase [Actinomycetota bacterium]|nr:purine-nucleoside phosphorylase [Actinomycetota bacterium]